MHSIGYTIQPLTFWERQASRIAPRNWRGLCQLPSSWAEVTAAQMLVIAPLAFQPDSKNRGNLLQIALKLSGMPQSVFSKLSIDQVFEITEQIKFLLETKPNAPALSRFIHKGTTYILPDLRMNNSTLLEYAMAEAHMKKFSDPKSPDLEAIDRVVAVLARREDERSAGMARGDMRIPFNPALTEEWSKELSSLPVATKLAVILQFIGDKKAIMKQYEMLWSEADPGEIQWGWTQVMYDLAEQGTFGDFEAVIQQNIHTILLYMYKKKIDWNAAQLNKKK